jgi:RNA polymerase sigma factor (sigma-70 family)
LVIKLAIDLSRRRKVRDIDENFQIELLVDPNVLPEINVITREQIEILWSLLGRLPEDVREMIVLRYMLGWQVKQIAEHLRVNENNVSVTIRRALKSLERDWPQSQEKDYE